MKKIQPLDADRGVPIPKQRHHQDQHQRDHPPKKKEKKCSNFVSIFLRDVQNLVLHPSPREKALLSDVLAVLYKLKFKFKLSSSSSSSSSSAASGTNGAFSNKTRRLAALVEGLTSLGHDASICRSRWACAPSHVAGDHEYADVLFPCGERLIVEIDFRSEFQVARPTKECRAVLALLPAVLVANPERLKQVVTIAAGAAKRSLNARGLYMAPWRTEPYMQAKWLAPGHNRVPLSTVTVKATSPSVPVVADAGCWANFGAGPTASVIVRRTRQVRVAAAIDEVRTGVNAKSSNPTPDPIPPSTRSRPAPAIPLAATRRVGWAIPGPGCHI